jgi:glycosyltransferase involved in cell wall biosynthesis
MPQQYQSSRRANQSPISKTSGLSELSVDVVIPVLNEAHVLAQTVASLCARLPGLLPYRWRVVIVDNGSTDGTDEIGRDLAAGRADILFLRLDKRGRGRALRYAWMQSSADMVCYMDVDLSTDLNALPIALSALAGRDFDIAVGSRLMPGSQIKRCFKREIISRLYNLFVKVVLHTRFSDAQCGFKALSRQAVERLVPQIKDQGWFFDSELLILAENQGYRIKDVPVTWNEDQDSRVKIMQTAWEDIKGVFRLRSYLRTQEFARAAVLNGKQVQTQISR